MNARINKQKQEEHKGIFNIENSSVKDEKSWTCPKKIVL